MLFKHILHAWQAMKDIQREKYYILTIPFSLDNIVNFGKVNCGRGFAKDLTSLQDSHRSYEENFVKKMHRMTDFDGERFMI